MRSLRKLALALLPAIAACNAGAPAPLGPAREGLPHLQAVTHDDGLFVAVGGRFQDQGDGLGDARIAISGDGETWTTMDYPGVGVLWDVAHGNDVWVAAGGQLVDDDSGTSVEAPLIMISADGESWRESDAPPPGHASSIAFGNGLFVTVLATAPGMFVSEDGDAWRRVETAPYWWNPQVEFLDGRFFVFGEGPALAESEDGIEWTFSDSMLTQVTGVGARGSDVFAIAYFDCCFGEVADGEDGYTLLRTAPGTWTVSDRSAFFHLHDVIDTGDAFLAASPGADLVRTTSADPAQGWAIATEVAGEHLATDGAGTVVGVSDAHPIALSRDGGATWRQIELPSPN
jgi:hypothetical protein